jgi:outer membrane protein assembly factor BamB
VQELVIVHGGEKASRSLFAFRVTDGQLAWSGGNDDASYASPSFATLADAPQILAFNDGSVSGHSPTTGEALWQRRWGNGNVVCASPVIVSSNRVLFSSGYGVGAELLEIKRTDSGKFSADLVWKSIRMKAKFAHVFARDGFLYGLDDGIFACVDLADGAQRWKEGRYGHGQGLLVGDLYLLLAESGELVLLRPTPEAPNEVARLRVFDAKTWNPPALAGDLLLVRNDREAACLRLKVSPAPP